MIYVIDFSYLHYRDSVCNQVSKYPMKKKSKKVHKSSKEKYYIPFLPDEVFNNLSPELKKIQQEYRTYHRTLHGIRDRINTNEQLIKKLREEIKNETIRIKSCANEDYPDRGYEDLVVVRYNKLSHLYDDYKFSVSITRKNRTSKSYKNNQKGVEGFMNKKFYGGKEIGEVFTYNAQIKSDNYEHSMIPDMVKGKKIKNISLGTEDVMRKNLGLVYPKMDFSEDSIDIVKDEWRTIIRAFSNWYITKNKWRGFKLDTHPKENIVEWCIKMGINEKNGEFENWIEKEG